MELIIRHAWLAFIIVVLGNAAFWRFDARERIATDPSLEAPLNRIYLGFAFWVSLPFLVMGLGIVTDNVQSVLHYLVFDTTNIFVVAFYALMFAEDGLFIFWVFFRQGAEKLALHTELEDARPKLQLAVRILALMMPIVHVATLVSPPDLPPDGF